LLILLRMPHIPHATCLQQAPGNGPPRAAVVLTKIEGFGDVLAPSIMTVIGNNFHVINPSPAVRVGLTTCTSSLWSSDSSILCTLASGYSYGFEGLADTGGQSVVVSFDGPNSTSTSLTIAFTYDAPVVTGLLPPVTNASQAGRFAMTVLGQAFGNLLPPSGSLDPATNKTCVSTTVFEIALGPTACAASAWTSDSSAACRGAPAGVGRLDVAVRMCNRSSLVRDANQSLTDKPSTFCYDPPSLTTVTCTVSNYSNLTNTSTNLTYTTVADTQVPCGPLNGRVNAAPRGGSTITLLGTNFGPWDTSVKTRVGDTAAVTIAWISRSAVTCLSQVSKVAVNAWHACEWMAGCLHLI
jgi:hypothetical protein